MPVSFLHNPRYYVYDFSYEGYRDENLEPTIDYWSDRYARVLFFILYEVKIAKRMRNLFDNLACRFPYRLADRLAHPQQATEPQEYDQTRRIHRPDNSQR